MTELEAIRRYWNTRAEGYSLKTAYDLQHAEKVWLERLRPFVLASGKLDILDIGCGPGFFSILLARLGHSVGRLRLYGRDAGARLSECRRS